LDHPFAIARQRIGMPQRVLAHPILAVQRHRPLRGLHDLRDAVLWGMCPTVADIEEVRMCQIGLGGREIGVARNGLSEVVDRQRVVHCSEAVQVSITALSHIPRRQILRVAL